MTTWYRVFGTADREPAPSVILEYLAKENVLIEGKFRGDDQGWFKVDFFQNSEDLNFRLERFLSTEEGIRRELNTWAAWLELAENNPHCGRLMSHMIGTRQLFTMNFQEGLDLSMLGERLCRFLAFETAGVYQMDGHGFFDADGSLLIPE